jgi:hypothetical protein
MINKEQFKGYISRFNIKRGHHRKIRIYDDINNSFTFRSGDLLRARDKKYVLIIGIVTGRGWGSYNDEIYYLCKISASSKPTFISKGHALIIQNTNFIESNYKKCFSDVLKKL